MLFELSRRHVDSLVSGATGALAALLVISLLSMPTMAASGARVPHSHSLFLLPGHDHRDHTHHRHGGQPPPRADSAGPLRPELPHLEEPSSPASRLSALPAAITPLLRHGSRRIATGPTSWPLPDGHTDSPDAPPP